MDKSGRLEAARILEELVAVEPPQERGAILDRRCGADEDLRARVCALVAALREPLGLADVPQTDEITAGPEARGAEGARAAGDVNNGGVMGGQGEAPGAFIGRYKLLQPIGEGGFGSIWMAEQEDPIVRRVALKVIKLGMDTKQVIARFEAERQALAMMEHPNIAKVLDAGATDSGRPYFVMELVKGVPITQYCDENRLPTRERLRLFVSVCNAVQHAHQKGIIHRDIKPSNVLVSMHDGKPVPKVIDFGIAKATQGRLTEKTLFTEFRQFVGTPEYMSPEQADMAGLDVDTRTDVYALGVLLYELLTGSTPFDPKDLRSKAYDEIQRIIREVDPPRPSTRVGTMGDPELNTVAARRGTEARRLGRLIRGELDWIVMKCLEKDRTRRYETANGLAVDVGRYLNNEPVAARRAGRSYRMRKFVKRHQAAVFASAAVLAALVLGFVGTSIGMWKATGWARRAEVAQNEAKGQKETAVQQAARALSAEQDAIRQRAAAEREARRAVAVSDFMNGVMASARADVQGGGRGVKVVDLLDRATAEIDQTLRGQPEAEINARTTLGEAYLNLGMPELANDHFEAAHRLAAAKEQHSAQAMFLATRLVTSQIERGRPPAEPLAIETYHMSMQKLGPEHDVTWRAATVIGRIFNPLGKFDEVEKVMRTVILEPGKLPGGTVSSRTAAEAHRVLAAALRGLGRMPDAEAIQLKAMDLSRADDADSTEGWRESRYLADILESRDKLPQARKMYETLLAEMIQRPGSKHPKTIEAIEQYAKLLTRLGDYQKLVEWRRVQLENEPGKRLARLAGLAEAQSLLGATDDAARKETSGTYVDFFALLRELQGVEYVERFREAAMNSGLGPHHRWRSEAVRSQVWCMMRNNLFGYPSRIIHLDEKRWEQLTFVMRPMAGSSGEPIAGTMARLRALETPADGLYLLSVEIPMDQSEPLRAEAGILFADWQVEVYSTPFRPDQDLKSWKKLIASPGQDHRKERALAMANGLTPRPGPLGKTTRFGVVATASVRLHPGQYRFSLFRDDGASLDVDGKTAIAPWSLLQTRMAEVELGGGEHTLRVEHFQAEGVYKVWLCVTPVGR
jgi:tetratricopeptide (TPR) repeat protein